MSVTAILQELKQQGIAARENAELASYTSFRIGGPCRLLVKPKSITEVGIVLQLAKDNRLPCFILGNGSNLLVPDEGYDGIVILTAGLSEIVLEGEKRIRCGAGVSLSKLCSYALAHSLSGLEFAWGIPGSVGGAVYMNAGAYGGEIKDVLSTCEFLAENGEKRCYSRDQLAFSYRSSYFTDKSCVIESAVFELRPDKHAAIKERMDDVIHRRTSKQPLEYPSAGSVFKRPEGAFAGGLIEQCGLKGYTIGGAQVSEKHAGFIINIGNATCRDVTDLITHIQQTVYAKTGYQLECEVKILSTKI